jgi:predicted metal-dependent phosphoesterase TrpH
MSEAYFKDVKYIQGPILALLKKEGYQAVDMHYHGRFSVDGLATVPQILEKCRQGSFGVAFTDHNHIEGAFAARESSYKDVFVIPGMEITCHNGAHILLHFYSLPELRDFYQREMKKMVKDNPWFVNLDHNEVVKVASKYNCLISAPHPFGPGLIGIKRFDTPSSVLKKIQAVEAINGCCVGEMNTKAIAWAKKIGKPFIGGSDGHCLAELGNVLTICKAQTVEEFLNQVKKGHTLIVGKEEKLLEDAFHALGKFVREEEKAPQKQVKEMWLDRGLLEWDYLKERIEKGIFSHHYRSHHEDVSKKELSKHKNTKHLV